MENSVHDLLSTVIGAILGVILSGIPFFSSDISTISDILEPVFFIVVILLLALSCFFAGLGASQKLPGETWKYTALFFIILFVTSIMYILEFRHLIPAKALADTDNKVMLCGTLFVVWIAVNLTVPKMLQKLGWRK